MSNDTKNRDRLGLEVLSSDECWELIRTTTIGRVAFVDAGGPVVLPVTHSVHGHTLVFRSTSGTKLGAAERQRPLAFEVDGWDADARTGWSVLVRGTGHTVLDDDRIDEIEAEAAVPWLASATTGTWVQILPYEISGRRIG
jgi:nitroimidazol reductase NimA-like FMN-containing flavoprotein (pyridoxamine 5'-phosphate oxidase superfamily)